MAQDKLTHKQEAFCQYVAGGETYADAYRKSYSSENMGVNTIYVKASQMMDQDKIKIRVNELRQNTIERNEVTIDEVLEQLKNWLLFDPLSIMDDDDCVKKLKDMDKNARMSLGEIKVLEVWDWVPDEDNPGKKKRIQSGLLKNVKFIDKRATAEMFMKKFGQYVQDQDNASSSLDAIRELVKELKK